MSREMDQKILLGIEYRTYADACSKPNAGGIPPALGRIQQRLLAR